MTVGVKRLVEESLFFVSLFSRTRPVRSFTGMDRNGPNYRNGLPEWTLICAIECDLCILLGQSGIELPQKAISPRNAVYVPQNLAPYGRVVALSTVTTQEPVTVPSLFIQIFIHIYSTSH